jgi:POT family proton-dependent oligopeptide transporter
MRNILVQFLISSVILSYVPLEDREGAAKDIFHSFVIGVYFFPLLGGWLSDRFFGKYNTVLWFSLIYCAGHACLAMFEDNRNGFYTGLFLIALGRAASSPGGVLRRRPVHAREQAPGEGRLRRLLLDDQLRLVLRVAADAAVPARVRRGGGVRHPRHPDVHRDVIFWLGRKQYVRVPPATHDPDSFLHVARTALLPKQGEGRRACTSRPSAGAGGLHADGVGRRAGVVAGGLRLRDHACLALGVLIACGGVGTSLQLERARGVASRTPGRRQAVRAVLRRLIRVRADHAVLVAVRPEGLTRGRSRPGDASARPLVVAELPGEEAGQYAGAETPRW